MEGDGSTHLGEWRNRDNRQCMEDIRPICGCQNPLETIQMREDIKTYFNSEQGQITLAAGLCSKNVQKGL